MLSTKNMSADSGKVKPVINAGNQKLKITSLSLNKPPYDQAAYELILNLETEPIEGDFEGFLVDVNNPTGPRYQGQVGRVAFQRYPYSDTTLPSGRVIDRDTEIQKALIFLADQQGGNQREKLDSISCKTIEEFVSEASKILSDGNYYNVCVGGREWENKEGYINLQLFLPKRANNELTFERLDVDNSKMIKFDRNEHIVAIKKSENSTVSSFEPVVNSGGDFDL
jgi:hypothetical protein